MSHYIDNTTKRRQLDTPGKVGGCRDLLPGPEYNKVGLQESTGNTAKPRKLEYQDYQESESCKKASEAPEASSSVCRSESWEIQSNSSKEASCCSMMSQINNEEGAEDVNPTTPKNKKLTIKIKTPIEHIEVSLEKY